ncbi:MAG: TetR/AcrR family transcriptional regulator, partial [Spirochaetes bacterium]|nr:TetR/AcrR family transcriptional regulator [Spirochaetota bacterium]
IPLLGILVADGLRMRGELRKKQILDCAKKIFSQKGFYDTQVDDIVEMARIGKGTIYQYFRNKEDVFLTLLETFVSEWEKFAHINPREISAGPPFGSFHINYLHARISKTLQFFQEDPDRSNIILRMGPGVNIEFDRYFKHFEKRILSVIINDIRLGQRLGNISKNVNRELLADGILGAVYRMAHTLFVVEREKYASGNYEEQLRQIILILANGIFYQGL